MPKATPGLNNFNAGQLSPNLTARTDLQKYAAGASELVNFIPTVQGPIRRRPGLVYVAEVANATNRNWLSKFIFNVSQSYVLEWGNYTLRFYTNRAQVLSGGVPYQITTPYGFADLTDSSSRFQLVFAQSADVIYITHRSKRFPVYKLERFGPLNWQLVQVNFLGGPFAAANPGTNPCVYAGGQTGAVTLFASVNTAANEGPNIFDPDQNGDLIGSLFQLTQWNIREVKPWEPGATVNVRGALRRYNGVTYEAVDGDGNLPWTTGSVPPTQSQGVAWDTGKAPGAATGHGVLWAYRDDGSGFVQITSVGTSSPAGAQVSITSITQGNPAVVTTSPAMGVANGATVFITGVQGMTEVNDQFFVVAGVSGNTFQLQQSKSQNGIPTAPVNVNATFYGAYEGGGTADDRIYTCTANVITQTQAGTVNRLPASVVGSNNSTPNWAYGAWNNRDGYPACVTFTRGRLAFARGGDIEFSVSQDFENFAAKTPQGVITPDMALSITLPIQDDIVWLSDGRVILAGTESSEQIIEEISPSQAFGPANAKTQTATAYGSATCPGLTIGQYVIFVQTSGRVMRAIRYNFYIDNYDGPNLSVMADEIATPTAQFIQFDYQKEPDSVIWGVRSDGLLTGLTFKIESQGIGVDEERVIGWHIHYLPDSYVESLVTIPSADGSQDDVWMIVGYLINGVLRKYVEYLSPHYFTGQDVKTHAVYLDCASQFNAGGSPTKIIPGLGRLEGQTVSVMTDGAQHADCVVSGGQITLNWPATLVTVGLSYPSAVASMPIEAPLPDGTAISKIKRVSGLRIRFRNTIGGQVGYSDDDGDPRTDDNKSMYDVIDMRTPYDDYNNPPPIFNGFWPRDSKVMPFPAGFQQAVKISYLTNTVFPATVVGIYPILETTET
jgi:hypothetical protein